MPAATVTTTASASPYVQLQPPVYVRAHESDSLAVSRVTLPGLASMLATIFIPQAWFFSTPLDFQTLAAALARVLEKFPVYAGRVVDVSFPRGTVSVETNNKGVPLHAGSANLLDLRDLIPDFAPGDMLTQHPSLRELLPLPTAATPADLRDQCTPLIVASLISLSDNACALSVRFWHGLFDQQSIGQFMQDWAQAYNGGLAFDDVEAIAKQTSRVEAAVSVPVDDSNVDMTQLANPMAGPVFFPDTDTINASTTRMIQKMINPRTVYCTAYLPQVAISQLVAAIRKIDPRVSQHDCVGAWLWKTLASARSRGTTRFYYPIDARWPLGAPLARGCLLISGVTVPAEPAATSLTALAGQIRNSVTDPSAFAKCVARYNAGAGPVMSSANVFGEGPGSAQDLCVMQWTRFANCDFTFGAAGTPVAFVPLGGPIEPRMPNLAAIWATPPVSNASSASGLVVGITLYEPEVPAFASALRAFADGRFDVSE
ncbi:hypothetical protein HDU87_001679 [Geranomyces variabilis]|uniref:Uncharacterized protein n=1 Tax=Geranomyces variabilis TaxID=109894 RepID=A0AAD5TB00_9FUNG|nr:hypothetical protein HDU87_001679 [Geranomyces variabilis]